MKPLKLSAIILVLCILIQLLFVSLQLTYKWNIEYAYLYLIWKSMRLVFNKNILNKTNKNWSSKKF